jgi:hypothetical protein
MPHDDEDFSIIAHGSLGANCCGCVIINLHDRHSNIACDDCGAVIRTVPLQTSTGRFTSWWAALVPLAPQCGELNVLARFKVMNRFIFPVCGESVTIARILS